MASSSMATARPLVVGPENDPDIRLATDDGGLAKSRLLSKLSARDRARLVVVAYESGFVTRA